MTVATAKKTTARRTRKPAAAKKTAPAKRTAKKTAAKGDLAEQGGGKLKKEQTFEERDWTYLDEKDPSEQHALLAKEINRRTNEIDINAKQVQAVLAMFPHFQRSATNKNRPSYHGLNVAIVEKRSEHMKLAHEEARQIMDGLAQEAAAKPTKKATAKKTATPAKKASTAKPVVAKKAPAKRARVTKPTTPAPAATEAF